VEHIVDELEKRIKDCENIFYFVRAPVRVRSPQTDFQSCVGKHSKIDRKIEAISEFIDYKSIFI
jgi:hypothetical protein